MRSGRSSAPFVFEALASVPAWTQHPFSWRSKPATAEFIRHARSARELLRDSASRPPTLILGTTPMNQEMVTGSPLSVGIVRFQSGSRTNTNPQSNQAKKYRRERFHTLMRIAKELGLTQQIVANRLGLSQNIVSQYSTGARISPAIHIKELKTFITETRRNRKRNKKRETRPDQMNIYAKKYADTYGTSLIAAVLGVWPQLMPDQRERVFRTPGHLATLLPNAVVDRSQDEDTPRLLSKAYARRIWHALWPKVNEQLSTLAPPQTLKTLTADPSRPTAALRWRGIDEEDLGDSAAFARAGDLHLLTYMGGTVSLHEDDIPHLVNDLLEVCHVLREKPMSAPAIIETLRVQQRPLALIRNPVTLQRGLEWLSIQGFPLKKRGDLWAMNGLSQWYFYTIDPEGWPYADLREEWLTLVGNSESPAIARRFSIVKELLWREYGLTWEAIGSLLGKPTAAIERSLTGWGNGDHDALDETVDEYASLFGFSLELFMTGQSRYRPIPSSVLTDLAKAPRSYRIESLLQWEGITRANMVGYFKEHGIQNQSIVSWRVFFREKDRTLTPTFWPILAALLRRDPYFLLQGESDPQTALAPMHWIERMKTAALAKGHSVLSLSRATGLSYTRLTQLKADQRPTPMEQMTLSRFLELPVEILFAPPHAIESTSPSPTSESLRASTTPSGPIPLHYFHLLMESIDHNREGQLLSFELFRKYRSIIAQTLGDHKADVTETFKVDYPLYRDAYSDMESIERDYIDKILEILRHLASQDIVILLERKRVEAIVNQDWSEADRYRFYKHYGIPLNFPKPVSVASPTLSLKDKLFATLDETPATRVPANFSGMPPQVPFKINRPKTPLGLDRAA